MQNQISKNSKTSKPATTIKELARNLRSDCYYFVQRLGGLGDSYLLCAIKNELEKAVKGKIIFVIKPTHEAIFQMFDENYVVCKDDMIGSKILNKPIFKQDYKPVLGQFYDPYSSLLSGISTDYNIPLIGYNELHKSNKYIVPTNLPKIDKDLQARLDKIAPLDKIILFCPEANYCPDLPLVIFKDRIKRLRQENYFVIVNLSRRNSIYRKHFIDGVYDLNLTLSQSIALALSCGSVISARSGFCDVIVRFCKNLKLYQTHKDFPTRDDLSLHLQEEIYVYDLPIYKAFLQVKESAINSLPLKLYKRYIAKGFLRRVRTPFTAYFKIYKNHKKQVLNEANLRNLENFSGENSTNLAQNSRNLVQNSQQNDFCKEFLNDLAQTYEFQIGLLLEKACKGFWRGGFVGFIFDYLKLRKRKKTLTRLNEILA